MKKFFLFIIIILFIYIKPAFSKNVKVFEFTYNELKNLKIRKVSGAKNKTIYTLGSDEKGNYYKAIANNAASGLGKEIKIDLNKTHFMFHKN